LWVADEKKHAIVIGDNTSSDDHRQVCDRKETKEPRAMQKPETVSILSVYLPEKHGLDCMTLHVHIP